MSLLQYQNQTLHFDHIDINTIAKQFGTPCYVYSRNQIEANWQRLNTLLTPIKHRICYAVKANSNLSILRLLANLNSSFDIVSLGELERVLAAGGNARQIIFSGVGKTESEIERAIKENIFCFDVESEIELERLNQLAAKQNKMVSVALRINPHIDPLTHAHISTGLKQNKFGIELEKIPLLLEKMPSFNSLNLIGLATHIGSQITNLEPFLLSADCLIEFYYHALKLGINLTHLNIGGGLGIAYAGKNPPSFEDYAKALIEKFSALPIELMIEPGRSIVGDAGILLTRVEYIKKNHDKNFAIVDAGMNDFIRPALYDAWQEILSAHQNDHEIEVFDIVGPVCESADYFGKERKLAIKIGDILAINMTGAYGFSMSSNYNSRPRPPEILIDQNEMRIIRKRESITELFSLEK